MSDPFSTSVSIDTAGAQRKIEALGRRLGTFRRTANRAVAVQMYQWFVQNFDNEGAKVGGWEPLRPATIRQKERLGKERMLVRSGTLRQSFLPFSDEDNAGIGSELEYAEYHEKGNQSRNLPRRPMLPTRAAVQDMGMRVYQFYVDKAVREA